MPKLQLLPTWLDRAWPEEYRDALDAMEELRTRVQALPGRGRWAPDGFVSRRHLPGQRSVCQMAMQVGATPEETRRYENASTKLFDAMRFETCLNCGEPISAIAAQAQRRRARHGERVHCRACSLRDRFPQPAPGNPLAPLCWLIRTHCLKSGRSLCAFARDCKVTQGALSYLFLGQRRRGKRVFLEFLTEDSIQKYSRALGIPEEEIRRIVPVTWEDQSKEWGRQVGANHWDAKHREALSDAHRGKLPGHDTLRRVWRDQRDVELKRALAALAIASETTNAPATRVKRSFGLRGRGRRWRLVGPLTAEMIERRALRFTGRRPFEEGGLPLLYVRGRLYELAEIPWPGKHPPLLQRFELVYAWKRAGKTWSEISKLLFAAGDFNKHTGRAHSPKTLARWWRRSWRKPLRSPRAVRASDRRARDSRA